VLETIDYAEMISSGRVMFVSTADKADLFTEVLRDLVRRWLVPIDRFESEQGDLGEVLLALARHLATSALTPESVSVNRIIISESRRRPEFGRLADAAARKPAVAAIASILSRRRSELRVTDYATAADQFLRLTIDGGLHLAMFGVETTPDETEQRARAAVDLFLFGARTSKPREAPGETSTSPASGEPGRSSTNDPALRRPDSGN